MGSLWDSTGLYLPQAGTETGSSNSLYFQDSSYMSSVTRLWFGTNNSRIYYSTNWGTSWVSLSTSPEAYSISILFNCSIGTGSGYFGGLNLYQTTNYGFNWSQITPIIGSGFINGISGTNPGIADEPFYCTWYTRTGDNKIYIGLYSNWSAEHTAPAGTYTYLGGLKPEGNGEIFGLRNNGGISYCSCTPSGISKISNEIPKKVLLKQNYPNPFNPKTVIGYEIPGYRFVRIIIYDVLGNEIKVLVNDYVQPGSHVVEWDASNYASGIYIYKLYTEGYTDTKSMVVLK